MKFTFYSKPGCPQCKVLKMKMDAAKVEYTHIEDEDSIVALGVKSAPVLIYEGTMHCGPEAIKWFTAWAKEHANGN